MVVVAAPPHASILLTTATQCCLFGFDFRPWLKGKHVQSFKTRRKVGKGFYSTAPGAPDGQ